MNLKLIIMKQILCFIVIILFSGCIEDYTPENIEEISDILVVEGAITNGESVFKLRRSVGLMGELTGEEIADYAIVYVEIENSEPLPGIYNGNGTFVVQTGDLDVETRYRLFVDYQGELYASEYMYPIITPEIDSVSFAPDREGDPVNVYVSTHDPNNQSKYFRWSYKEIWEAKAELVADLVVVDGSMIEISLSSPHNTYYCWVRDSSKMMILESTEKLSENVIYQKKLTEIPVDNDRLSELYYINVEQTQISKEAFYYYSNLQKNIEQTGSIFAPMPNEIKGNIECITNPNLMVIGFVDVSTTTQKKIFSNLKDYYVKPESSCLGAITDVDFFYPEYAYIYYRGEGGNNTLYYAPHTCVDCRLKDGATKNRPDFWPNDHN